MPNELPPLPEPEIRSPDGNGFSYAQVREIQAIARAEGREEMREWKASRVRDEAWQPIETAPKDGLLTMLLVPSRKKWLPLPGYWTGAGWLTYNHDWAVARVEPTHWMPMPAPPVGTPKSAEGEGA
jgi:hypothetical protein